MLWGLEVPPPQGSSNMYPQSMFLSKYKTNNVYPCKHYLSPEYIKWVFSRLSSRLNMMHSKIHSVIKNEKNTITVTDTHF